MDRAGINPHSCSRRGSALFHKHYSAMLADACSLPVHYVTLAKSIWRKFTEGNLDGDLDGDAGCTWNDIQARNYIHIVWNQLHIIIAAKAVWIRGHYDTVLDPPRVQRLV